jgi:hypothetical protein
MRLDDRANIPAVVLFYNNVAELRRIRGAIVGGSVNAGA